MTDTRDGEAGESLPALVKKPSYLKYALMTVTHPGHRDRGLRLRPT